MKASQHFQVSNCPPPPVQREGFPYINVSGWEKLIQFLLKKCVLNTKIIVVIPLVLFGRHSRLYTKLIKKKEKQHKLLLLHSCFFVVVVVVFLRPFFPSSRCTCCCFFWCWFLAKISPKFCSRLQDSW